jgi:hypothetical protein
VVVVVVKVREGATMRCLNTILQQERPSALTSSESHSIPYLQPLYLDSPFFNFPSDLKCTQIQQTHQSIIPYRQPKAPEQTTRRQKNHKDQASHPVSTTPLRIPEAWRRLLQLGERDTTLTTTWAQPLLTGSLPAILTGARRTRVTDESDERAIVGHAEWIDDERPTAQAVLLGID